MSSKLNQHTLLVLTFLVFIIFMHSPATSSSETECPYPCYPSPPTGTGNYPPAGTLSPPLLTGGSLNPPQSNLLPNYPSPPVNSVTPPTPDSVVPWFPYYYKKSLNPPQSDLLPNNLSPPYDANSVTPTAPDSVVPWFPYYYKKLPQGTDQSSSTFLHTRAAMIGSTNYLVLLLFLSIFC